MLDWKQLVHLSDDELARLDVAGIHLACAEGLPGAEHIDVERCLRVIGHWSIRVCYETFRQVSKFHKYPERFDHSLARFRVLVMVTVLQRDLGVRPVPRMTGMPGPEYVADARNLFLHSVVQGKPGNCATLPIVYASIARRLGYPLRLVRSTCHMFARWDEPRGERFNVECTTLGFETPSDESYLVLPWPANPDDARAGRWLESLTPRAELAGFLTQRGYCLAHNHRYREAAEACAWAASIFPANCLNERTLRSVLDCWRRQLAQAKPSKVPPLNLTYPAERYPLVPIELQQSISSLAVWEQMVEPPEKPPKWDSTLPNR